jgi:hypothetical protein
MTSFRFRLRSLMIAVLVVGLVGGDLILVSRRFDPAHSYGFPPDSSTVAILIASRLLCDLLAITTVLIVIRWCWRRIGRRVP